MLTGLVHPRYSPSSTTAPSASTARAAFRRRLRMASRAMSARLAKCVAAPRAARPPASMDSGMKRRRKVWSSWPSKLPASFARTNPRPAPARQIQAYRRRLPGSAAVFRVVDMLAVPTTVEPAAEEAAAIDQVKQLARSHRTARLRIFDQIEAAAMDRVKSLARNHLIASRLRIFDQIGNPSLGPGGPVDVEAAQNMILFAIQPDDGVRRLGILDLSLRPEAERDMRRLPEDGLGLPHLRAAHPEIHLEVVVIGEGADLAHHLLHLVQELVGRGGGDRLRLRRLRGLRGSGLRFRRGGFLGLRLGGHRQPAPPEAGERD